MGAKVSRYKYISNFLDDNHPTIQLLSMSRHHKLMLTIAKEKKVIKMYENCTTKVHTYLMRPVFVTERQLVLEGQKEYSTLDDIVWCRVIIDLKPSNKQVEKIFDHPRNLRGLAHVFKGVKEDMYYRDTYIFIWNDDKEN